MQTTTSTYQNRGNFYLSSTNSVLNACRSYELANHLGNVLSVISDKVIPHVATGTTVDYFLADIRQSSDYSPFGVQLSGRNFVKSGAKEFAFGFQGQLEDDEIKGEGNSVNYTFRMHDPRLGRFFAIDPLTHSYPWNSPYAFSENRVTDAIELEGLEQYIITKTFSKTNTGLRVSLNIVYVKENQRKPSSEGADDANREVDYIIGGVMQTVHTIPANSEEKKQIARTKYTRSKDGKFGANRTLSEAIESGNTLLEGTFDVNGYPTSSLVFWKDITLPIDVNNFKIMYETSDANEIGQNESDYLGKTVEFLVQNPELTVTLVGTTSRKGSDSENLKLSQKRADRVKKAMITYAQGKGYDVNNLSKRVTAEGKGSQAAIKANKAVDNNDASDRKVFVRFNAPQ